MTNLDRIKALMSEHQLSRQDTATLLGVNKQAVDSWFFHPDSRGWRQPSDQTVKLLELTLRLRAQAQEEQC